MCGIAGAVGAVDDQVVEAVRAMTDAEAHRGPDDSGFFRSERVAFGFRRLSILDLTAEGHQPMSDPASGSVVVFNGEIYNFAELRADLESRGAQFRSSGDTEVLLKSYVAWQTGALSRFRGMFGFAVYDPGRRRVLLARDRLGIKPVYYTTVARPGGEVVLFASELRALLASGLVPRRADPQGLASYLWNGFVVGPATLIAGVRLLAPGAFLDLDIERPAPAPRFYFQLAHRAPLPAGRAVEALAHELAVATRQHMVSDVPLGVFLSGGVDSSAIAALAVRSGSGTVKTFHIGFEEAGFDESAHARRVASALGTEHAEFRLTQERFREQIEPALASLDQPTFDAINTYLVSRVVREAGLKVALAGTGGDELFGGYRSFRDLPRGRAVGRLSRLLPRAALARGARAALELRQRKATMPAQTRWGKLADALAAGDDLVHLYQVAYGLFTGQFLEELAGDELSRTAPAGLPGERAEGLGRALGDSTPLSAISLLELSLFIGERLLRDTDAASMAVSLEVRVPLLDHAVVEAALAVPDRERFHPLGKKRLLKTLALSNLDPAIFERPKAGFVLPIEVWAKDRLASEIDEAFADRSQVEALGLRHEALCRLWQAFKAGAPGLYWSRVWAPYVLLRWCRLHGVTL